MTSEQETDQTPHEEKSFVEKVDSAPFQYRFGGILFMATWAGLWLFAPTIPILQPGTLQDILALSVGGRIIAFGISLLFAWPVGMYVGYLTWDMFGRPSPEKDGGKA